MYVVPRAPTSSKCSSRPRQDSERYRASLRQEIRDWVDSIHALGGQEYLIVHVAASRQGAAKFYQRKSTVLEKIRTDFGTSKRERSAA